MAINTSIPEVYIQIVSKFSCNYDGINQHQTELKINSICSCHVPVHVPITNSKICLKCVKMNTHQPTEVRSKDSQNMDIFHEIYQNYFVYCCILPVKQKTNRKNVFIFSSNGRFHKKKLMNLILFPRALPGPPNHIFTASFRTFDGRGDEKRGILEQPFLPTVL